MKNQIGLWAGCFLLASVVMAPQVAHAQMPCSNASLSGGWGYGLTGIINTSFGKQDRAEAGLFTFDGAGHFTLKNTQSINYTVTRGIISTGTYSVNANCTGTLIVHRDADVVHFSFTLAPAPILLGTLATAPPVFLIAGMSLQCTDQDAEVWVEASYPPFTPAHFQSTYTGTAASTGAVAPM